MLTRLLAVLLILLPGTAVAQVTGRFYLEKQTFAPGEPVFLYFEATNSGTATQNIDQADPYNPICSGYQIRLSSDTIPDAPSSCEPTGIGGDCISSDSPLAPEKTHSERILLNYQHTIGAPGYYEVDAVKRLPFASADVEFFSAAKTTLEIHQVLHFWIDKNAVSPDPTMQAWVNQLRSSDESERYEAARILATMAPKSLESVLLSFADHPEFRAFAPLAFHGLNTPSSIMALADLLRQSEPGTPESMDSADFLAQTDDSEWFPLLLEVAQKNPQISTYLVDAAESGGEQILPFLRMLLNDSDETTQANAVSALGYTGSRDAVPILLTLLRSTDSWIAQSALYAMRQLTHRLTAGDWQQDPQSQYPRWAHWWNSAGLNASVYKPNQCGEVKTLL